jgi:hypothetical protein
MSAVKVGDESVEWGVIEGRGELAIAIVDQEADPCGVPKFGAHCEKSAICWLDHNFGTPHA